MSSTRSIIYIFLSNPWNSVQNRSYFRIQPSINKYKKIGITCCILSDHKRIKLELDNKRNYRKYSNTWRLNNILLNSQSLKK
jgi:hypothetical protein